MLASDVSVTAVSDAVIMKHTESAELIMLGFLAAGLLTSF